MLAQKFETHSRIAKQFRLRSLSAIIGVGFSALSASSHGAQGFNNASEMSVFDALQSSCFFNTDTTLCSAFSSSFSNPDVLTSITPLQILSIGSAAMTITGGQLSLLNGMVSDRGRLFHRPTKGGGAGDEFGTPLNFWFKTDTDFGQRDTTFTFAGFKFNNFGLNAGADYRLTDNWVTGLAFTYQRNNARFDAHRGDTDSDAYSGSIYTSYYITDALHVEATGSYGGLDYETSRNVTLVGGGERLRGAPGAEVYTFSFGGGYDFNYRSITFAPYARTDYIGLDVESFKETGGVTAVRFNKQNIRSLTSTVGAQLSTAVSFPWGVLTPQLRSEWHHQFENDARTVNGYFLADPSRTQFGIVGDSPTRDYCTLGADLSGTFAHGVSAFLSFQTLLGVQNVESHKVMLGTRLEF
jgi:uncharacterized protein with beta-barrel porin domain